MSINYSIGDHIVDIHHNKYAIIYVSTDITILCLDTSPNFTLTLIQQPTETVLSSLENGSFRKIEPSQVIVNVDDLSPKQKQRYERNLNIINEINEYYGPGYLELTEKSNKHFLQELSNKYGISIQNLRKIIIKYLRSGCQLSSLIDQRGAPLGRKKYSTPAGRTTISGEKFAIILTEKDIKNMDEAVESIRKNHTHSGTKKDAYVEMLRKHYCNIEIDEDGNAHHVLYPMGRYPTLRQFYNFVNKKISKNEYQIIRTSAREYQNNHRAIIGTERNDLTYPGELCDIDATPTDIYLVSKNDPEKLVNRAHMYLIIDVLTGMIISGSVSFEDNSNAAVSNVMMNLKREGRDQLLAETHLTLESDDLWPTDILPGTLRCDRGSEFTSKEFRRKCHELNIAIQLVPAATGSMKGTVEKEFHQFNLAMGDTFEKRGLILKRHDSDHKKTACLNIDDMRKIMVSYIIYHNNRVIESRFRSPEMIERNISASPVELWKFYSEKNSPRYIHMNVNQYIWTLMKPAKASMGRQGIVFKGLHYMCNSDNYLIKYMRNNLETVKMDIRYDEASMRNIYYIRDGVLFQAHLNPLYPEQMDYANMSYDMFMNYQKRSREQITKNRHDNLQKRIAYNKQLEDIRDQRNSTPSPTASNAIRKNSQTEKEIDNKEHSFTNIVGLYETSPDSNDNPTIEDNNSEYSKENNKNDNDLFQVIDEKDPEKFKEAFLKKFGYKD